MTGTICLAVYRPQPELLRRQIASIKAQDLTDWTCLVGVDGPDDEALAMLGPLCATDPRFRLVAFDERLGHFRHFERLMHLVPDDAGWVALSDQDDVWRSDKLARLVPLLDGAALVQGEALVADATGRPHGTAQRHTGRGLAALLVDNQVTGSFAVMRTDLVRQALPFPSPTDAAYHDHWLGVCGHLAGGLRTVHEPLQTYVQHDSNVLGESAGGRWATRLTALGRSSGRRREGPLRYLAEHRYGWRARMSRSALERFPEVPAHDRRVLTLFAGGRLSPALARVVTADALARRVPSGRAAGVLVGAARAGLGGGDVL